ncbi:MAG TPA: glycoside hydrolase family 15 protein [Streptosporangiaceae bacterium]|jgi:GH15 family glucan-1,4-alpha-glucosidase
MAGRIEDYAIIGDMQSAALVGTDGSIDWLCLPRFDSPACFAALLGDERNGNWRIAPTAPHAQVTRRYQGDTLILESEWRTATGTARVIDFMPRRDAGVPVLVRIVEGVQGTVEMDCTLRVRFGYGHVVPWARRMGNTVNAIAGPDSLWVISGVPLEGRDLAHRATFTVEAGQRIPFTMTWTESYRGQPEICDPEDTLEETTRFWNDWTSRCTYQGHYREPVIRSLITLKALTYEPTGGIVAAATTSLPEDIGGSRNWDYRYCWLRDATITLEAFLRTGYTEEATAWQQWLSRAIAGDPADVQIMYGVGGERRLAEWEAEWLPGYEASAPVRIGNAAVQQRQLDVYGEVVDALCLAARSGIPADRHIWSLQRSLLDFLEKHWHEPDEGIWEVRGPRRDFVHSKVMAWVAFDRAATVAAKGLPGPADRWRALRDQIHAEVTEKGYNAERGAFTQYYGSPTLDASVLLMAQLGFLPPDDPRLVSTVDVISRELVTDGLVRRYQLSADGKSAVDGLPGSEGAFLACSFWLADALHLTGRADQAVDMFEKLLGLRNDVGLLSEEYDPRYGRLVGNMPQAFSHMPLIQTALNLEDHAGQHRRRPVRRSHDVA